MSEILALKGRLQAAKDTKRHLEAQAAVQIRAARDILNPFEKPVSRLKDAEALAAVNLLSGILASLRETETLIGDLEQAIGE